MQFYMKATCNTLLNPLRLMGLEGYNSTLNSFRRAAGLVCSSRATFKPNSTFETNKIFAV